MFKKLTVFLLVFVSLISVAYASDASITSVKLNSRFLGDGTNVIDNSNSFIVYTNIFSQSGIDTAKVEVTLTEISTGNSVKDISGFFTLGAGKATTVLSTLKMPSAFLQSSNFRLDVNLIDSSGSRAFKSYTLLMQSIQAPKPTGASQFSVSIDKVRVNSNLIVAGRTNFVEESGAYGVNVEFTAIKNLQNAHVEVILKDIQSGLSISDASPQFNLEQGKSSSRFFTFVLPDEIDNAKFLEITVRIVDILDRKEQNTYQLRTDGASFSGSDIFDVSIDRVKVNSDVVAQGKTTFIDESDIFNVIVDITANEDLENGKIEAVLRDTESGKVVADTTGNFNLQNDQSTSQSLRLELKDGIQDSENFELAIRVSDTKGHSKQQNYGITTDINNKKTGSNGGSLDVSIDNVEVNKKTVAEDETNFVQIKKGSKSIDLKVAVTSLENDDHVRIESVLMFENGDVVADTTKTFDLNNDEEKSLTLELTLPGTFEMGNFKLRVKVIDAEDKFDMKEYGLKLVQQDFPFAVTGLNVLDQDVEAGKYMRVKFSFKNSGIVPLEGMVARASIPELGVSQSKFVGELRHNADLVEDEFMIKVPNDASTGTYYVRGEIYSQFSNANEQKEVPVYIIGKQEQNVITVNDQLVITVPVVKQNIGNDGKEVTYPITFTNNGPGAETYTFTIDDKNWASVRIEDSNTFILKSKESKTFNLIVSTKTKELGERSFVVDVLHDGASLKKVELKAKVISLSAPLTWKQVLMYGLVALVILLAIAGFALGLKKNYDEDAVEDVEMSEAGNPYYV